MEMVKSMSSLISDVRNIVADGRRQAYVGVNVVAISTYWNVGRRIVEEEQHGEKRAEYGKQLIDTLAKELVLEFGGDYSARRLRDYRQFYLYFQDAEIWHARVPNLTWTHFRYLLRVETSFIQLNQTIINNKKNNIMKAIYQSPKNDVITITVEQMIAASLKVNGDGTITQELGDETNAVSGNLSRRRNLWEDEDALEDEDF